VGEWYTLPQWEHSQWALSLLIPIAGLLVKYSLMRAWWLDPVTRDALVKFPLAKYAGEHWFEHARFEGVSENADEGMKKLLDPKQPHFAIWLWIYDPIVPSWN
jgi:hypothetical protein